jgi:apolipoprotein N-acyltransferase
MTGSGRPRGPLRRCAAAASLLLCHAALFGLSHPGILSARGFPIVSYFAYVPLFLLASRTSRRFVWLAGFACGALSYGFFAAWLTAFHPLGLAVMSALAGAGTMLAFVMLKLASVLFPERGWIVQWLVWLGYEFVRTLGYAGHQYGLAGYTQWRWLPVIRIADVTGVWGVGALVVFVSAWLAKVIADAKTASRGETGNGGFSAGLFALFGAAKSHKTGAIVWLCCLASALAYGVASRVDYSGERTVRAALVQTNTDPWKDSVSASRGNLETLTRLSDAALKSESGIALVVWPETAFVPRVAYHYYRRTDRDKFELVEKLLAYIDGTRAYSDAVFVIGNDHAEEGWKRDGRRGLLDYNSVLVFAPGRNVVPPAPEIYKKTHLVPFTEYFPFEKRFPRIYELLLNGDTHMWEPGTESVVFEAGGLRFSTPVCFEDTFGSVVRRFVNNGARAIVNLSNDAWSKSLACQYQHLSMAVFRSVENRVPSARSTASGQTAIIDPNGKIVSMAEPFAETFVVGDIPVRADGAPTVYTRFGDWFGVLTAIAAGTVLAAGIFRKVAGRVSARMSAGRGVIPAREKRRR